MNTDWIYPRALLQGRELKDFKSFVYIVNFPELDSDYVGYKSLFYKTGRETDWKTYKTSSKSVKKLIADGHLCDFYIVRFFETQEEGVTFEHQLLQEYDAKNQDDMLNIINGYSCLRDVCTYDDEWRTKVSNSLKEAYSSGKIVHPLKGKEHPNKGKKLPQTKPKKHVSVENKMVTNGVINKWVPKNEPLEDGYRVGTTHSSKPKGGSPEFMRELNAINTKRVIEQYNNSKKVCAHCQKELEYEDRMLKTHVECRSAYRSKISSGIVITKEASERIAKQNRDRMVKSKGFDSYGEMCLHVASLFREGFTYTEISDRVGVARSTLLTIKKYLQSKDLGWLCEKSGDLEGVECFQDLLDKLR